MKYALSASLVKRDKCSVGTYSQNSLAENLCQLSNRQQDLSMRNRLPEVVNVSSSARASRNSFLSTFSGDCRVSCKDIRPPWLPADFAKKPAKFSHLLVAGLNRSNLTKLTDLVQMRYFLPILFRLKGIASLDLRPLLAYSKLRTVTILCTAIFAFLCLGACSVKSGHQQSALDSASTSSYLTSGRYKFATEDYVGAISDYDIALEMDPTNIKVFALRGLSKYYADDHDGAIADLNIAIAFNPEVAVAIYTRGKSKFELNDYDGALSDFDRTIELDPDRASAYVSRGNAKYIKGDNDGAAADFEKAHELDPGVRGIISGRVLTGFYRRRLDKEAPITNQDYEFDFGEPETLLDSGEFHDRYGTYGVEIAEFTADMVQDPTDQRGSTLNGIAKFFGEDYEGAFEDLTRGIELYPDLPFLTSYRGRTLLYLGKYYDAIADFNRAIAIDSMSPINYVLRGRARTLIEDYAGAVEDYSQAIAIRSDDPQTYYLRGYSLYFLGDFNGAIADHNRAIAIDSEIREAYIGRAIAKEGLEEYEGAVEDYSQAIAIRSDDPQTYYFRGSAYYSMGDNDGAIADFDKAIALNPDDPKLYNARGNARQSLGNEKSAIVDFQRAIKLWSAQTP